MREIERDIEEVIRRVQEIEDAKGDPETAHSLEDDLYEDVLRGIANGEFRNPHLVATVCLVTKELDFPRWCG